MRSLSLVMSECSLSGRGQGHVGNFYTVDLENFATARDFKFATLIYHSKSHPVTNCARVRGDCSMSVCLSGL